MCLSDEDCIHRCLDGDPSAYRRLVQRHQQSVLTYLAVRLGSEDLAEEVAQEAFVRAYFSLSKLRKRQSFLPWVLAIATRVRQEVTRSQSRLSTLGDAGDIPVPVDKKAEDPPVAEAVARLPAGLQEVIFLRYQAGLSCRELAERLRIPLGSVTKRLSRAYALLRTTLKESGWAPSESEVTR